MVETLGVGGGVGVLILFDSNWLAFMSIEQSCKSWDCLKWMSMPIGIDRINWYFNLNEIYRDVFNWDFNRFLKSS